ncbi:sigma-70 family RNA polymerase sigma factor [Nitrincola sp.]|uniref:sigma-70 family RNA polymerase sigma factor n=1 Tax=Nitrincola sp. TaxID=1926584 RepID=UPI003A941FC2
MSASPTAQTQAIGELYVAHSDWLSRFIQRRVGCPHTTADLIQDTYLRLLTSGRLPEQQDARRFLTHVSKGLVIDLYRRKRIEDAYLVYLKNQPEYLAPSLEEHLQMIQALTEIDTMLHRMPEKVRQTLLLRQFEGLSYKDIAERLGVSISSVEKYMVKALQACLMLYRTYN